MPKKLTKIGTAHGQLRLDVRQVEVMDDGSIMLTCSISGRALVHGFPEPQDTSQMRMGAAAYEAPKRAHWPAFLRAVRGLIQMWRKDVVSIGTLPVAGGTTRPIVMTQFTEALLEWDALGPRIVTPAELSEQLPHWFIGVTPQAARLLQFV